jgi:hypothetical protein
VGNSGEYLDMDLEKAIRFKFILGPTIIPAGRIIAPFGGQFWDTPADPKLLNNPEYSFADSQDEMPKAVRENLYWGQRSSRLWWMASVISIRRMIFVSSWLRRLAPT